MRFVLAVVSVVWALAMSAQSALTADALLQRGREHFRAGRYAEAAGDLGAAAQSYLSSDEMQAFVRTGRFDKLPQFETALVYLALAQARLGNEAEARAAVQRLATAERIAPTYATLHLDADAAEFEALASRLAPDITFGRSVQVAGGGPTPSAAPPPPPASAPAPVVATSAERVDLVEQMVAQECARIQREADEKIAAVQRAADERVAAAERAAAERVAEIQRAADARVAAAEASARVRVADEAPAPQPRPQPTAVPRPPEPAPVRRAETLGREEWAASLRRADSFAEEGRAAEANEIYLRVAGAEVPRQARVHAAVGLYRTGAYRDAAAVFERLAPFARGEEDLRYYNAVSLFESGRYREAQHELACALPYIRLTDDVIRYRTRIEQMVVWQNAMPAAERSLE